VHSRDGSATKPPENERIRAPAHSEARFEHWTAEFIALAEGHRDRNAGRIQIAVVDRIIAEHDAAAERPPEY
jgi:hypothetical protein